MKNNNVFETIRSAELGDVAGGKQSKLANHTWSPVGLGAQSDISHAYYGAYDHASGDLLSKGFHGTIPQYQAKEARGVEAGRAAAGEFSQAVTNGGLMGGLEVPRH